MRSGCFRWRIASASSASRGVGASRYNCSASSRVSRAPARTRSAIASQFRIIKAQLAVEGHEAQFSGIPVKRAEPVDLRSAQRIPNIIAQIPLDSVSSHGCVRKARRGNRVDIRHPGIACLPQTRDVLGLDDSRPSGPEGVDEWQAGDGSPQLAEIDLAGALDLMIQEQRLVAD